MNTKTIYWYQIIKREVFVKLHQMPRIKYNKNIYVYSFSFHSPLELHLSYCTRHFLGGGGVMFLTRKLTLFLFSDRLVYPNWSHWPRNPLLTTPTHTNTHLHARKQQSNTSNQDFCWTGYKKNVQLSSH